MRNVIAVLFLLVSAVGTAEADVTWSGSFYQERTVVFTPDKGAQWLPPTHVVGIGVASKYSERWSVYTELGVAIPVTGFTPAPRLLTAPTLEIVKGRFSVAFPVLWQVNPPYDGTRLTATVATGIVPTVQVNQNFAVGVVLSPSVTVGDTKPVYGFTVAPYISVNL